MIDGELGDATHRGGVQQGGDGARFGLAMHQCKHDICTHLMHAKPVGLLGWRLSLSGFPIFNYLQRFLLLVLFFLAFYLFIYKAKVSGEWLNRLTQGRPGPSTLSSKVNSIPRLLDNRPKVTCKPHN